MQPTQELMQEHKAILSMLQVLATVCKRLEAGQEVPPRDLLAMLDFLKTFADKCHHGKEEEWLFPAMERAGVPREQGPIGVMLSEHALGRKYIAGMGDAMPVSASRVDSDAFVRCARNYVNLLTGHIQKEDMVLFPMADRLLSKEAQETVGRGFERIEEERIGGGKHESLHAVLEDLKGRYR